MERLLRLPLRLALMPSCCVKGIALAVKRNTSSGLTATALPLHWQSGSGTATLGSAALAVPLCHCATASGATAPRRHCQWQPRGQPGFQPGRRLCLQVFELPPARNVRLIVRVRHGVRPLPAYAIIKVQSHCTFLTRSLPPPLWHRQWHAAPPRPPQIPFGQQQPFHLQVNTSTQPSSPFHFQAASWV